MKSPRTAFTLVEILVVLAIIAILSAILFPVFGRAREGGRQANCASNLHQIWVATRQYYDDERRYPESIRDLLPDDASVPKVYSTPGDTVVTQFSKGYLKGGASLLHCIDDDTEYDGTRSSYGNVALQLDLPSGSYKNGLTGSYAPDSAVDPGRYVWNFWGYDNAGWSYLTSDEAITAVNGACPTSPSPTTPCQLLQNPNSPYDRLTNPIRFSLSNRFAAPRTIITHCIYHRTSTSGANYPGEVGVGDPTLQERSRGARDVVLRLDGTTKTVDVSTFQSGTNEWQQPKF